MLTLKAAKTLPMQGSRRDGGALVRRRPLQGCPRTWAHGPGECPPPRAVAAPDRRRTGAGTGGQGKTGATRPVRRTRADLEGSVARMGRMEGTGRMEGMDEGRQPMPPARRSQARAARSRVDGCSVACTWAEGGRRRFPPSGSVNPPAAGAETPGCRGSPGPLRRPLRAGPGRRGRRRGPCDRWPAVPFHGNRG